MQHLIEGLATRTEQHIVPGGVREIVAELAGCEPLAA